MRRLGHKKRDANMRVDSYIEGWNSLKCEKCNLFLSKRFFREIDQCYC